MTDRFRGSGWQVREFDLALGDDLRCERSVSDAIEGCEVVVHAGAIAHDGGGTPADIVATNVLGTWHVLLAAERHAVSRVVCFSSVQVFGFADGEGVPDRLPITDHDPLRAARPYGMSKRLVEEMCDAWTSRTAIPTILLRPVRIVDDRDLHTTTGSDGVVHVDDVADATIAAATSSAAGHHRVTLCGSGPFDTSAALHLLGWRPTRT